MIRTMFAVAVIALGVGVAAAQQDPIAARKSLMKANGDQAKVGAAMMKGEAPFDLDKARAIFAAFGKQRPKSRRCSRTIRRPAGKPRPIRRSGRTWTTSKQKFAKLGTDAKDAAAKVTDLDSFKAAFGNIGKNDCGGCHEKYRIKKS